jgi:hypothetical protein
MHCTVQHKDESEFQAEHQIAGEQRRASQEH